MIDGELSESAGLYIHVPFCTSVCPYCDFAVTIAGEKRRAGWAAGLRMEAERYCNLDLDFDTVYLGGGTPSSLGPGRLLEVLDQVGECLRIRNDAFRYLEINPEDVTAESARIWRRLGFSRVSLGVQSFDDRALRFLGRAHTAAEAKHAAFELLEAGFETVSLDLIFGLDGQSPADWRAELRQAVAIGVDHLSCYQLTFHDGTIFGRRFKEGRVNEAPEPQQAELYFLTHTLLADAGYEGYEVSNFASAEAHRSHHNLKYWNHTPYLGLGPSAHSFVGGRRWWNLKKVRLWQSALGSGRLPVAGEETLSSTELLLERVILGLRTKEGVDLGALGRAYEVDLWQRNRNAIGGFRESGHLLVDGETIRPTIAGMAIADTLGRSIEIPETPTHAEATP